MDTKQRCIFCVVYISIFIVSGTFVSYLERQCWVLSSIEKSIGSFDRDFYSQIVTLKWRNVMEPWFHMGSSLSLILPVCGKWY